MKLDQLLEVGHQKKAASSGSSYPDKLLDTMRELMRQGIDGPLNVKRADKTGSDQITIDAKNTDTDSDYAFEIDVGQDQIIVTDKATGEKRKVKIARKPSQPGDVNTDIEDVAQEIFGHIFDMTGIDD